MYTNYKPVNLVESLGVSPAHINVRWLPTPVPSIILFKDKEYYLMYPELGPGDLYYQYINDPRYKQRSEGGRRVFEIKCTNNTPPKEYIGGYI